MVDLRTYVVKKPGEIGVKLIGLPDGPEKLAIEAQLLLAKRLEGLENAVWGIGTAIMFAIIVAIVFGVVLK